MINSPHPERSAPAAPLRESQRGIGDEVRSAVDIHTMVAAFEKGIRDLRHATVQRNVTCNLNRGLGFVAVGPAGTLELETSVIRDVYLLVRVVNQKCIRAERESPDIRRCPELVEVCRGEPGLIRALNDTSRVYAVDPASVVQI